MSVESTAWAIASSVETPMLMPVSCCPMNIVTGVSQGTSSWNGTVCVAPSFSSSAPPSCCRAELDVLLHLPVVGLHLDLRHETDGQPLDLLVDGARLDVHLTLYDAARHHVRLVQDGVHRRTSDAHTREQLLETHLSSPSQVLPVSAPITRECSRYELRPATASGSAPHRMIAPSGPN